MAFSPTTGEIFFSWFAIFTLPLQQIKFLLSSSYEIKYHSLDFSVCYLQTAGQQTDTQMPNYVISIF